LVGIFDGIFGRVDIYSIFLPLKQNENSLSVLFHTEMLTHLILWFWTIVLHSWVTLCRRQKYHNDNLRSYESDLRKWNLSNSIFDIHSFKKHPAWKHRYLQASCFLYSVAYQSLFGGKTEMLGIQIGKEKSLLHVYNIDSEGRQLDFEGYKSARRLKKQFYWTGVAENSGISHYKKSFSFQPEIVAPGYQFPLELCILKICIKAWEAKTN